MPECTSPAKRSADGPRVSPFERARCTILVVDDDASVLNLVSLTLQWEGYRTATLAAGAGVAEHVKQGIDLVILDLDLPDASGLDILRSLRTNSAVPVVILSGHTDDWQRVIALRAGADDYVVKPFCLPELVARIDAVLSRSALHAGTRRHYEFDELRIDTVDRTVAASDARIMLTPREFDLLAFLAAFPHRVFRREDLLREVWGTAPDARNLSTVTEHVRRLRTKLRAADGGHQWITTVFAVGYCFTPRGGGPAAGLGSDGPTV